MAGLFACCYHCGRGLLVAFEKQCKFLPITWSQNANVSEAFHNLYLVQLITKGRFQPIDPSHKSHNALDTYPLMHHFVTEICTHVHISVTKWWIVWYGTGALWDFCNRSIADVVSYPTNSGIWHIPDTATGMTLCNSLARNWGLPGITMVVNMPCWIN